jgi:hypothetical protein
MSTHSATCVCKDCFARSTALLNGGDWDDTHDDYGETDDWRASDISDNGQEDDVLLLDELHYELTRYVAFPSPEAADAVTLYAAATHVQPAWEHATRLVIKSPVRRCGKTRLLEVLQEVCENVLATANCSVAALTRSIGIADRQPSCLTRPTPCSPPDAGNVPNQPRTCAASSTPVTPAAGPTSAGTP